MKGIKTKIAANRKAIEAERGMKPADLATLVGVQARLKETADNATGKLAQYGTVVGNNGKR